MPHPVSIATMLLVLAPACVPGTVPSLVTDSPFLPPGFTPPGQGTPPSQRPQEQAGAFSFRGVYMLNGTYHFNIHNQREQSGQWLTASGSSEDGIDILHFDEEANVLKIRREGKVEELALIETSDRALPVQTAPATTQAPAAAREARETNVRRPVRRRVIRPNSGGTGAPTPTRRRVVRPQP